MKLGYPIILMLLFCFSNVTAQQFTNGSLEPVAFLGGCSGVASTTYNSNMGGAWDIGNYTQLYIRDSSCNPGVVAGSYTGLQYGFVTAGHDYNTLVLQLNAPLIKDASYKITFSHKLDTNLQWVKNNVILKYGYAKNFNSKDSISGSIDSISNASWITDTLKITPKVSDMQYIWLEPCHPGVAYVLIYVDEFKVAQVTMVLEDAVMRNNIHVYPNPVRDNVTIELSDAVQLPCALSITDISGMEVMHRTLYERKTIINKGHLNNGIYFMQLIDSSGAKCVQKMIVE